MFIGSVIRRLPINTVPPIEVSLHMSGQAKSRDNFEAWFGTPLQRLMRDRNSGLAVAMVAFPLLERYLKQKSQSEANKPPFNRALLDVLPELQTVKHANLFWAIYRHGLLHNLSPLRGTHWLSHDKPIVEVQEDGRVWLNPNLFAKRVLDVVRNDFEVFEAGVPLPEVMPFSELAPGGLKILTYIGTGAPPGRSGQ